MSDKESIIEKIQKLLALAQSSNEHEATAAMERAQALMLKHNIEMRQVTNHQADYTNERTPAQSRMSVEDKHITGILRGFFFVEMVYLTGRRHGKRTIELEMIGEKVNVTIALYMYDFLKHTYRRLFKEYKELTGCDEHSRQAFYAGITDGISEKMVAQRASAEQEYGLVLVEDPRAQELKNKLHPETTKMRMSGWSRDDDARSSGRSKGQELDLNLALGQNMRQHLGARA